MTAITPSRQTMRSLFATALLVPGLAYAAAPLNPLPEVAPAPADNPTTPAKVKLGQMLFMDPRLSSTGTVSCNSCHNVMLGGEDNRPVSVGVHGQTGGRSAPTVWNAAFNSAQFWDGRAASLEDQAKGPVTNPIEMGMPELETAMQRLRAIPGYAPYFEAAFGKDAMSIDNAAKAIAAFERTLITPNSPYDRYAKGDRKAMSKQQLRGLETFTRVGCGSCHSGAAFNGPQMPAGQPFLAKFPTFSDSTLVTRHGLKKDEGRYEVTGKAADKHMFKVPTLRNVALTAPYFHNGAVATLEEAVRIMAKTQLNRELTQAQTDDIVAFLEALTGEFPELPMPRLPATSGHSFEISLSQ